MDSFIQEFKNGQEGKNLGLPVGLRTLDLAINGLQRRKIISVAAAPKVGKSLLTLQAFIIYPYLHSVENNVDVDFIVYSLEMGLNDVRYRTAAFFFYYDYGIKDFEYNGKTYTLSPNYLLGKEKDEDSYEMIGNRKVQKIIKVSDYHKKILKEIYINRIIPMFGEYNGNSLVKPGKIKLIVDTVDSNPTGVRNYLLNLAKDNGKFLYEDYVTTNNTGQKIKKQRLSGYEPNNPKKYTIVLIDHVRKLPIERGFTLKQNIDKMLEYEVQLRNLCNFTFINVIHLNRQIVEVNRMKYSKETLFPIPEDIKDSGNLSEESDTILTMMNPTDERYKLINHFGVQIDRYPDYRSIHLVESRDTPAPIHIRTELYAGVGVFVPLVLEDEPNRRNESNQTIPIIDYNYQPTN